jgi:hypothetical protein
MALKDPELLATSAAAVGADTHMPFLHDEAPTEVCRDHQSPIPSPQPTGELQTPHTLWNQELEVDVKLLLQEDELAMLLREAEDTKRRIAEVRRQAKVASVTAAEMAKQAAEAATREEAKLVAAHALAEAREQEHKMAVQAAIALKAQQDKELARERASKEAEATLAHREQVLAAAREENARMAAKLAHTMQVAQQTADLEAKRIAAVARAPEKEASEQMMAKGREEARRLNARLQDELAQVGMDTVNNSEVCHHTRRGAQVHGKGDDHTCKASSPSYSPPLLLLLPPSLQLL